MSDPRLRRVLVVGGVLMGLGLALLVVGLGIGSTGFTSVFSLRDDPVALQIVRDIRLPRTLGAWLAGALLGLSGAVAQGLFRNPLADPYLLGSASGALLGVAFALLLFGGDAAGASVGAQWALRLGLTGAAFVGATAAVLLTLALARGVQQTLRLLLAGVIVGVVLGATKDLVTLQQADILVALTGFMLGNTGLVGWSACATMAGCALVCVVAGRVLAPVLDGLALGEATAASLGLPLPAMRAALVAVLALATGAAVAQTGLIAFVGLAAPHLVRSVVKTTHAGLIVLSAAMGGLLLMAADLLARWLVAPQELPVGVLTALLGGGYLLWLMRGGTLRGARGDGAARRTGGAAGIDAGARVSGDAVAIEARGVGVALGGVEVLHDVDLALAAGRWSAVVGPNGAGKSTLLRVLAGLQAGHRGEVRLGAAPLAALPGRERARRLSWLGQGGAGDAGADDLRVHDVAMLGRLPHQRWLAAPNDADRAAVERALRETQAWDWRDRPLGELSGGERQRVLLARALAVEAEVVLMDEPLANLDPPHQADWMRTARALAGRGRTVVSVLHELSVALAADDLVVMAAGRVVHHGGCDDPATHAALEAVFDRRVDVHRVAGQWIALPR